MRYTIDFQYFPKGAVRPVDDGTVRNVQTDDTGFMLVPNIGDHVHLVKISSDDGRAQFSGRVRSRLFTYLGDDTCGVNIVVEEVEDSVWGELIKE